MKMRSCQAPLMDESCRAIATYLSERLDEQVLFIEDIHWEERYRQLDRGELDLAWICGGPYVRRVDRGEIALEPLVAPVWRGERYAGQPVYFSDLIVRGDRAFRRFADLRWASWAYN